MLSHVRQLFGLSVLALAAPASAQSFSAELYGGGTFERSEDYSGTPFDLHSGPVFGVGIYKNGWVPGVEIGLDIMRTESGYVGFGSAVESRSLMAVGRLPFALAPNTTGYIGAGLGMIDVTYDGGTMFPAFTGSDTAAGGQISLGIRQNFASGMTLFGELKHQAAFDDAEIAGETQSYGATSAVIGVGFSF